MFPDYSLFRLYHKLHNKYTTLSDTTRLKIEGVGTIVYCLNGKVLLTRNTLHTPALRGALYSLCEHSLRLGYGVLSFF